MAKKGDKSKKKEITTYSVRLKSMEDMVRAACTFSPSPIIFAVKERGAYTLMLPGERVDESSNIYTFETGKIANFCIYSPSGALEKLEFKDEVDMEQHDFKTYRIQIIELLNNPFKGRESDGKESLLLFKVRDPESLIKGMLAGVTQEEKMGRVYQFGHNGKKYLCAFNTAYDGSVLILYSEAKSANVFNFISYNYSSNKLEFLKSLENNAYVSLAVVNLAEPFPFFKPE